MNIENLGSFKLTIGAKQTAKAIARGQVHEVFVGRDSEALVIQNILDLCKEHNVPINQEHTMSELGKAANIKVKAAAIGALK